jgi:hypothetical protein
MNDTDSGAGAVDPIKELVARLIREHRQFPPQVKVLNDDLDNPGNLGALTEHFMHIKDTLTEHMLTEEFEFYPELVRRDLFDENVSAIMQQHHDVTAALSKMELTLRLKNMREFKAALDDLERVLDIHHPAEEDKVFPLVA